MHWFGKAAVRVFVILVGAGQAAVLAHQMEVAMTTVSFKPASGSIEIIHRFYAHDTEQVLSELAGKQVDLLDNTGIQQQFGRYVGERFGLSDQATNSMTLALVGVEFEGNFIWVYQESMIPAQLETLTVFNTVLMDSIPTQVNTVNIECGDIISTLVFSSRIQTQSASIDFSQADACALK